MRPKSHCTGEEIEFILKKGGGELMSYCPACRLLSL